MKRLLLALFMISLGMYTAFGIGDKYHEPSSPKAQEGKVMYVPINPAVNSEEEQKIQQDYHNITGHGKAK